MKAWIILLFLLALPLAVADYYNVTRLENANNLYDQALALNEIVTGILGYGFIIVTFTLTFAIVSLNYGALSAYSGASFITAIMASMLLPLGFIPFWVFEITLVMAGIGIFLSIILRTS